MKCKKMEITKYGPAIPYGNDNNSCTTAHTFDQVINSGFLLLAIYCYTQLASIL